jgi:membrane protein insertase Oxa1/YidC/SpoIIIJ
MEFVNQIMEPEKNTEEGALNQDASNDKTEKSVSTILVWLFFIFFPVSLVLVMIAGIIKMTISVIQPVWEQWFGKRPDRP